MDDYTPVLDRLDSLFLLRFTVILFSVATWHSMWNESSFSGTLLSNSCRLLESDTFLFVLLAHFVLICIALGFFKRRLNIYLASINIIFGAYIVMALKPPSWYLSFKWEDCYDLYDNNNNVSRTAMFSYALLTCGAVEMIELLSLVENISDLFRCVQLRSRITVSLKHLITILVLGGIFFGISLMMWSASYDKS